MLLVPPAILGNALLLALVRVGFSAWFSIRGIFSPCHGASCKTAAKSMEGLKDATAATVSLFSRESRQGNSAVCLKGSKFKQGHHV